MNWKKTFTSHIYFRRQITLHAVHKFTNHARLSAKFTRHSLALSRVTSKAFVSYAHVTIILWIFWRGRSSNAFLWYSRGDSAYILHSCNQSEHRKILQRASEDSKLKKSVYLKRGKKASNQVAIGSNLEFDGLRKWREFPGPTREQRSAKPTWPRFTAL